MSTPSLSDLGLRLRVLSSASGMWIIEVYYALFLGTNGSSKGPRIALINNFGREHTIRRYRWKGQADDDLPNLMDDLNAIGYYAWAEKVGVPPHFELMHESGE
jgi:hypothetical protein